MRQLKIIVGVVLFILLQWDDYTQEHYFQIINAYEFDGGVLEEWKRPGRYSPINMFDNDTDTCFAIRKNNGNDFIVELQLESPITCDRMEVLGGVALNEDLYVKNNRPREFIVWLYATEEDFKNEIYKKIKVILEDKREYQVIQFDKPYTFKRFSLQTLDVYKGTKYDDTAVTELKLFNGSIELKPKDILKMKKVYIQRIGERLREFLRPGVFDGSEERFEVIIDSKGYIINWKSYDPVYWQYYKDEVIKLKRIFVKDSQLYVEYGGRIYLTQYILHFYSEKITSLLTSLIVFNIGDIENNNLEFIRRDQKELINKLFPLE
ncbi:MAG: hypothetical protein WBK20_03350 [Spirochaetota bacterium]